MITLFIETNINTVKYDLEFIKLKLEAKEEISPEIVQEAIKYYTKLVKQINELIELIEKYEKAINEIDDYVNLIRIEVDNAR